MDGLRIVSGLVITFPAPYVLFWSTIKTGLVPVLPGAVLPSGTNRIIPGQLYYLRHSNELAFVNIGFAPGLNVLRPRKA